MGANYQLYVIVARVEDCYMIVGSMDEVEVKEGLGSWEQLKSDAYKLHGPENVRIAKLKTKRGWMEPLFNEPAVTATPVEKVEAREEVSGCSVCPLKSFFMSEWFCTHPGVKDVFKADPTATRLPSREKGSPPAAPDWCPLSTTPVMVRRTT